MTVDAHVHVWDLNQRDHSWTEAEHPSLVRSFLPDELRAVTSANRVSSVVLVQVLHSSEETAEFLALAAAGSLVEGASAVVGFADLEAPDVAEKLARLRAVPGGSQLAGVRHLVQAGPADYLARPAVQRGLAAVRDCDLVYDLLVRAWQLPQAVAALDAVEGLSVVLDHGGKPPIRSGELDPWRSHVARLAANPAASCKLSGLVTEAGEGWSAEQVRPFTDHLLECFGPERCCAGSDWPVCTAFASYEQVWALIGELTDELTPAEREAVVDGNARRIYRLPAVPGPTDQ
jgi:L-fuconolactonase